MTADGASAAQAVRKVRVLVVDDHRDTRGLIELLLQDAGYEVMQAEDGTMALDVARRWRPEVIVTDVFMDPMDGVDLIQAVRRQGWRTTETLMLHEIAHDVMCIELKEQR